MTDSYSGFEAPLAPSVDPYAGFSSPNVLPNAIGNVGADGNTAGESLTLSKKSGVPGAVIDADLLGFKQDYNVQQAGKIVQSNPIIQSYLQSDPLHAKISHDDYEHLDKVVGVAQEANSDSLISRLFNATRAGIESQSGETQTHQELRQNYPAVYEALSKFSLGLPDVAEAFAKVPGQVIGGIGALGAQAARESGMSDAWAARLERDLGIIGQGVMVEPVMGLAGAKGVEGGNATAKAAQTLRPESAEMLKRDITPPLGFDPIVDEVHTQQAKLDSINLDKLIAERDQSTTRTRSVDAFEDLATKATEGKTIGIPADAIADLYASEKKVPSSDDGLLGWIPDLEQKVKDAQATGGDVEVSLGGYVARIDGSVHTKLQDFLRLRRDGVSLAEAKELKETAKAQEEQGFDVYHGSPHSFDAFSLDKIGTGEGAQSYGHGLYFAENQKVAEEYQRKLAPQIPEKVIIPGNPFSGTEILTPDMSRSNMYQARILANKEDFLDWDKPINEQSPAIQSKLGVLPETGKQYFEKMTSGQKGSEIDFSNAHAKMGIPGLKYLDQGSRGKEGEGTRNYVLFDDSLVRIRAINGNPVAEAVAKVAQVQEEALYLNPVFADAKAAGMTEPEFKRYSDKINARQDAIDEKAISAASREIKRRQSAEWKSNEQTVRQEVQTDTKYNPTLMADQYFRTGESPNEFVPKGLKLSDTYKRAGLPKEMFSKDGTHPDDIAPLFGFNSGEALLNRLEMLDNARKGNKETPDEHLKRIVNEETDRRMEKRYGNLDENIRAEATEAVMGHNQLDILDSELRALARQNNIDFPLSKEELQGAVKRTVARSDIKSASDIQKFQKDIANAGRQTELALLKGKIDEAFKWKQRQVQAFMFAKEATQLQKEMTTAERQFRLYDENQKVPGTEQQYTNQIQRILDQAGWSSKQNTGMPTRQAPNMTLEDFTKYKTGLGAEMPVADFLFNEGFKKPYDSLTTDEFRAIADSVQTLAHNGREENKIIVGAKKQDYIQTVQEALNQISDVDPKIAERHPGFLDKAASWVKSVDATLLKMEQMLRWLDKRDKFGVFSQTVMRPIEASKSFKDDMLGDLGRKFKEFKQDGAWMKSLGDSIENDHLLDWQSGEPRNLTRGDMIAMMLHMGNESNFKKLTASYEYNGKTYQWAPSTVEALIDVNAKKADWDFVQHIWDIHESYWPKIEDLAVKMSGVIPDKIEGRSIKNDHGDFKGGYMPLDADALWPEVKPSEQGLFKSARYFNSIPPKGYQKARTEAAYPLELNFNKIVETMRQTVHDLAYRESLTNAAKFLDNTEIRGGIQRFFGPEYLAQVRPWLEDIARNSKRVDDKALGSLNAVARLARTRTVTVQMMYRLMTAFKHGAAAGLYSVGEVGLGVVPEMGRLFGTVDGRARIAEIMKESGELRNRLHNSDRDIGDALDQVVGESGFHQWLVQNGGIATAALDLGTAIPTYEVALKKALKEGKSYEDAIYAGEATIRDAHGSSGQPDLAAIMRGNEWIKLSTIAFGTFNHNYGRVRDAARLTREGISAIKDGEVSKAFDKFSTAAWRMSWYLVLTALAEEAIAPIPTKDGHEGFAKWAAKGIGAQLAGTIPWVRDAVRGLMYGRNDPTPTPISQIESSLLGTMADIYQGKMISKGDKVRHAIESTGYVLGIPGTGQLGVTSKFLMDLNAGTQKAENPYRFGRGIVSGRSHPEKFK